MEFPRLPRFNRAPIVAPIELTERDREMIRHVYRHRFLRSSHLTALVCGSRQQVLRRLQLLYHHGYLERPRCQLDYYYRGGSRVMAYGLGDKGADLLRDEGVHLQESRWGENNRAVGRVQLEHWLMVAEVMVAIEVASRSNGSRLIKDDDIGFPSERPSFSWNLDMGGGVKLGLRPDQVFALQSAGKDGNENRAFFFLEADRGTMPVVRKDISQTSMYRKLLAYEATWSQEIHRTRFGFNRFRVLIVTESPERVNTLLAACSQLKRGHGLFLFADWASLEKNGIFSPIWQNGRGETVSILN